MSKITVKVQTQENEIFQIEISLEETVKLLKGILTKVTKTPIKEQKLTLKGKELKDEDTIKTSGIENLSTLEYTESNEEEEEEEVQEQISKKKIIQIKVHIDDDTNFFLKLDKSESIEALKEKIEKITGKSSDIQRLIGNGKQMEHKNTLSDYDIKNDSVIYVIFRKKQTGKSTTPLDQEMDITVNMITGQTYRLHVNSSDSVKQVKQQLIDIQAASSIDSQRFIYMGTELEDEKILQYYSIEPKETICCVIKLRGC